MTAFVEVLKGGDPLQALLNAAAQRLGATPKVASAQIQQTEAAKESYLGRCPIKMAIKMGFVCARSRFCVRVCLCARMCTSTCGL